MVEAQVGDTVVVIDRVLRRTTLFDGKGEVIGTSNHTVAFTLPVDHMMSESCCVPLGVGSDGTVVWRLPDIWSTEGAGLRNTYAIAVRRGREGGQDTVGVFRSGIAAPWEGPNRVVPILFSPRWVAAVEGERLYHGTGRAPRFTVTGLDGSTERIVSFDLSRIAVERSWLSEWREQQRERMGTSAEIGARRRDQILDKAHADSLPLFEEIFVDSEGWVWLYAFKHPLENNAPAEYIIFDESGRWLGSVEMPSSFRAMEIGSDYVIGVRRGEYDQQFVELYRLTRVNVD